MQFLIMTSLRTWDCILMQKYLNNAKTLGWRNCKLKKANWVLGFRTTTLTTSAFDTVYVCCLLMLLILVFTSHNSWQDQCHFFMGMTESERKIRKKVWKRWTAEVKSATGAWWEWEWMEDGRLYVKKELKAVDHWTIAFALALVT